MVNILVATNSLSLIKSLTNKIITYDNVRINKISTTVQETLDLINESNNIDFILLDFNILGKNPNNFFKQISQRDKYKKSILIIIPEYSSKRSIETNTLISDYILSNSDDKKFTNKINSLIRNKDIEIKRKEILRELTYIKYSPEYRGTNYLIDTILHMYLNKDTIFNDLQNDVYPTISRRYKKSVNTLRCDIRRATTCMYYECDVERLREYFGVSGAQTPTVKEVIYTVLNKIA